MAERARHIRQSIDDPEAAARAAHLRELVLKAQAAFDSMPPEKQRLYKLSQRISFVFGQMRDNPELTREAVARTILTNEGGGAWAELMLSTQESREILLGSDA